MLVYILIVEGLGKSAGYVGVANHMQAHGADGRLLPLIVLTKLGAEALLARFGLKTRWTAIALCRYCAFRLLFADGAVTGAAQAIRLQKNAAMAGGFLALALLGPWRLDPWRARAI